MIIKKEIPILKFFLLGLEYIGFISHDNNIFFNLTSKPLYVSSEFGSFVLEPSSRYCDGDVIELPPEKENFIYIVEQEVFEASQREDLCTSVKLDFGGYNIRHQGLILIPIKE